MCIKSGIKKCDGYSASGKSLVRVHAQGSRQNKIVLLEDCRLRFDLAPRTFEQLETTATHLLGVSGRRIGYDDRPQIGRQRRYCEELALDRAITDRAHTSPSRTYCWRIFNNCK